MDSRQPPEAKSASALAHMPPAGESSQAGMGSGGARWSGGAGGAGVQRLSKPPAFLPQFVMLCIRPETWAEVCRLYPTRFTIMPLVLAVVLAAAVVGFSENARLVNDLQSFAATYDAHYPPT